MPKKKGRKERRWVKQKDWKGRHTVWQTFCDPDWRTPTCIRVSAYLWDARIRS